MSGFFHKKSADGSVIKTINSTSKTLAMIKICFQTNYVSHIANVFETSLFKKS